ncbi:hypothetical protein BKA69DRAFT_1036010 [Paraphysoderma sedebokerense]|nr:hypothetical protein BKA69DRAFT_1036010 [Paraphysoderma sedebokerense]
MADDLSRQGTLRQRVVSRAARSLSNLRSFNSEPNTPTVPTRSQSHNIYPSVPASPGSPSSASPRESPTSASSPSILWSQEVDANDPASVLARQLIEYKVEGTVVKSLNDVAEFLGKKDTFSTATLQHYLKYFNFEGLLLHDALRFLCSHLYLRAETQQIDRILAEFSQRYLSCNHYTISQSNDTKSSSSFEPNSIANDKLLAIFDDCSIDLIHTITYSLILLNTDLHVTGQEDRLSRSSSMSSILAGITRSRTRSCMNKTQFVDNTYDTLNTIVMNHVFENSSNNSKNRNNDNNQLDNTQKELETKDIPREKAEMLNRWITVSAKIKDLLKIFYKSISSSRIRHPEFIMSRPSVSKSNSIRKSRPNSLFLPSSSTNPAIPPAEDKPPPSPSSSSLHSNSSRLSLSSSISSFNPYGSIRSRLSSSRRSSFDSHDGDKHRFVINEASGILDQAEHAPISQASHPNTKSAIFIRKHLNQDRHHRAQKRSWKMVLLVLDKTECKLHVFKFLRSRSDGGSNYVGAGIFDEAVKGDLESEIADLKLLDTHFVGHSISTVFTGTSNMSPTSNYATSRPYVLSFDLPDGATYLFQGSSSELMIEWIHDLNWVAARWSRESLIGAVGNSIYGWEKGSGAAGRLSAWRVPGCSTMKSTVEEAIQIENLKTLLKSLENELEEHTKLRTVVEEEHPPKSTYHQIAQTNYSTKLEHIKYSISKYKTYIDVLTNPIPKLHPVPPLPSSVPASSIISNSVSALPITSQQKLKVDVSSGFIVADNDRNDPDEENLGVGKGKGKEKADQGLEMSVGATGIALTGSPVQTTFPDEIARTEPVVPNDRAIDDVPPLLNCRNSEEKVENETATEETLLNSKDAITQNSQKLSPLDAKPDTLETEVPIERIDDGKRENRREDQMVEQVHQIVKSHRWRCPQHRLPAKVNDMQAGHGKFTTLKVDYLFDNRNTLSSRIIIKTFCVACIIYKNTFLKNMEIPHILTLSPTEFIATLRKHNISTVHVVYNPYSKQFDVSHPILEPIAEWMAKDGELGGDWDGHEGVFITVGEKSGVLQSAAVHKTFRGAGAGGVRNHFYDTMEHFIRDGLRLSKGMSHKNALAGLWWGGGKGVMARNSGKGLGPDATAEERKTVYEEYGEFMTALKGCYVTAEDVGTNVNDMSRVFSKTRFTTCIPKELGGSGNPSVPTARGVAKGLQAAFDFLGKPMKGATIAVQGVGHVGLPLCENLFNMGVKKIIACDIDPRVESTLVQHFKGYDFQLKMVGRNDLSILFEDVDAVCPCATGGVLNKETIPKIKAKIICGAANNQLLDLHNDDKLLLQHGITYLPDFLVNRMGIVTCCDEAYGYVSPDPFIERHLGTDWKDSIYNVSMKVLNEAKDRGTTTQKVAISLAEDRMKMEHPIIGHRGWKIIDCLVKSEEWKEQCGIGKTIMN